MPYNRGPGRRCATPVDWADRDDSDDDGYCCHYCRCSGRRRCQYDSRIHCDYYWKKQRHHRQHRSHHQPRCRRLRRLRRRCSVRPHSVERCHCRPPPPPIPSPSMRSDATAAGCRLARVHRAGRTARPECDAPFARQFTAACVCCCLLACVDGRPPLTKCSAARESF